MAAMAGSFLCPKPLRATATNTSGDLHFQISRSPRSIARSTRTNLQRGRSVLVSVATEASSKDPAPPSSNKGDAKISGVNAPTTNNSVVSLQFPNIPPTWSTWLTAAAVLLSVPLYRRLKKVQEVKAKAEKTMETAIRAMDKAAEEAGMIAADLEETARNGTIEQVALKIETIAERIERDEKEILHEVKHIAEEFKEMLEPIVESGEEKGNTTINKSEAHNNDL